MSFEVQDPNNPTFGEMSVTIYPQFVPYEKPYSLREFVAAKVLPAVLPRSAAMAKSQQISYLRLLRPV